jgi:hypothetical protein
LRGGRRGEAGPEGGPSVFSSILILRSRVSGVSKDELQEERKPPPSSFETACGLLRMRAGVLWLRMRAWSYGPLSLGPAKS